MDAWKVWAGMEVGCGKVDYDADEDEDKINAVKADDSEGKASHLGE